MTSSLRMTSSLQVHGAGGEDLVEGENARGEALLVRILGDRLEDRAVRLDAVWVRVHRRRALVVQGENAEAEVHVHQLLRALLDELLGLAEGVEEVERH